MDGLAVVDGDLVLSGGTYLTFTGTDRIRQDLTFALTDVYGADPDHPYWGSILNDYLGEPVTPALQQQVVDEVKRVLNNYIAVQADQVAQSVSAGTRGSYSTNDVVNRVLGLNVQIQQDQILITVDLQTMAGELVTVTRTVGV